MTTFYSKDPSIPVVVCDDDSDINVCVDGDFYEQASNYMIAKYLQLPPADPMPMPEQPPIGFEYIKKTKLNQAEIIRSRPAGMKVKDVKAIMPQLKTLNKLWSEWRSVMSINSQLRTLNVWKYKCSEIIEKYFSSRRNGKSCNAYVKVNPIISLSHHWSYEYSFRNRYPEDVLNINARFPYGTIPVVIDDVIYIADIGYKWGHTLKRIT